MAIQAETYKNTGEVFKYEQRIVAANTDDLFEYEEINMSGVNDIKMQVMFVGSVKGQTNNFNLMGSLDGINYPSSLPYGQGFFTYRARNSTSSNVGTDYTIPALVLLWYGRKIPFLKLTSTPNSKNGIQTIDVSCLFS